jgi:hypothetical protein
MFYFDPANFSMHLIFEIFKLYNASGLVSTDKKHKFRFQKWRY